MSKPTIPLVVGRRAVHYPLTLDHTMLMEYQLQNWCDWAWLVGCRERLGLNHSRFLAQMGFPLSQEMAYPVGMVCR